MQCIGYPKMAKVKYTYYTATLVTTACVCTNVKAKHKKHSKTERYTDHPKVSNVCKTLWYPKGVHSYAKP